MGGRSRKKMPKLQADGQKTLAAIVACITQLYTRHESEISRIREGSEQKIINVGFSITDDRSDVEPVIKAKIGFVERHTDNLTCRLGSPDQERFTFDDEVIEDQNPVGEEAKPKRGRPKKEKQHTDEVSVPV